MLLKFTVRFVAVLFSVLIITALSIHFFLFRENRYGFMDYCRSCNFRYTYAHSNYAY